MISFKGWVINRDGDGALGQAIVQAFEANSRGEGVAPKQHLTWIIIDPSQYPSNDDVAYAVVDEKAWAAVVGTYILFSPPSTLFSDARVQ